MDLFHSERRTEANQYDVVYRILLDEEYRSLLAQAGFPNIQLYGDYALNPYTKDSRRLIVVAQA